MNTKRLIALLLTATLLVVLFVTCACLNSEVPGDYLIWQSGMLATYQYTGAYTYTTCESQKEYNGKSVQKSTGRIVFSVDGDKYVSKVKLSGQKPYYVGYGCCEQNGQKLYKRVEGCSDDFSAIETSKIFENTELSQVLPFNSSLFGAEDLVSFVKRFAMSCGDDEYVTDFKLVKKKNGSTDLYLSIVRLQELHFSEKRILTSEIVVSVKNGLCSGYSGKLVDKKIIDSVETVYKETSVNVTLSYSFDKKLYAKIPLRTEITASHVETDTILNDKNYHWHACSVCGDFHKGYYENNYFGKEKHSFVASNDVYVCSVCKYELSKEGYYFSLIDSQFGEYTLGYSRMEFTAIYKPLDSSSITVMTTDGITKACSRTTTNGIIDSSEGYLISINEKGMPIAKRVYADESHGRFLVSEVGSEEMMNFAFTLFDVKRYCGFERCIDCDYDYNATVENEEDYVCLNFEFDMSDIEWPRDASKIRIDSHYSVHIKSQKGKIVEMSCRIVKVTTECDKLDPSTMERSDVVISTEVKGGTYVFSYTFDEELFNSLDFSLPLTPQEQIEG